MELRLLPAASPLRGVVAVPGDKSLAHRAALFSALADGESVVSNYPDSGVTRAMRGALETLGVHSGLEAGVLRVTGRSVRPFSSGGDAPPRVHCGNSGTTFRLLAGAIAAAGIPAILDGSEGLRRRPMERIAEPRRLMGADVTTTGGHAPLVFGPAPLHGIEYSLPVASAQVLSCLELAALGASGESVFRVPGPVRDHTERMLKAMGAKIDVDGLCVRVQKSNLKAVSVDVPADISSAAYFMALGALKGKTLCKNVGINRTRTGILTAFEKLGVKYSLLNERVSGGEEVADILVEKSFLRAIELGESEVPAMIDELPLIALLCAFADGESRITGARELKVKESDRIKTTAELINALGGECIPTDDGFIIRGKKKLQGGTVNSCFDHRIAMTGAVALLASEQGGEIENAECCAISFPTFFEKLGV